MLDRVFHIFGGDTVTIERPHHHPREGDRRGRRQYRTRRDTGQSEHPEGPASSVPTEAGCSTWHPHPGIRRCLRQRGGRGRSRRRRWRRWRRRRRPARGRQHRRRGRHGRAWRGRGQFRPIAHRRRQPHPGELRGSWRRGRRGRRGRRRRLGSADRRDRRRQHRWRVRRRRFGRRYPLRQRTRPDHPLDDERQRRRRFRDRRHWWRGRRGRRGRPGGRDRWAVAGRRRRILQRGRRSGVDLRERPHDHGIPRSRPTSEGTEAPGAIGGTGGNAGACGYPGWRLGWVGRAGSAAVGRGSTTSRATCRSWGATTSSSNERRHGGTVVTAARASIGVAAGASNGGDAGPDQGQR